MSEGVRIEYSKTWAQNNQLIAGIELKISDKTMTGAKKAFKELMEEYGGE